MQRLAAVWAVLYDAANDFFEDGALTRGAAIAFYAMTAVAPILYISAYVGGMVLGGKMARSGLVEEISRLAGHNVAEFLQSIARSEGPAAAGYWTSAAGILILVLTAGGVFMEVQSALNAIWKAAVPKFTWLGFLQSWAESLVMVVALGLLMLASLIINALLEALGSRAEHFLGVGSWLVWLMSFAVSSVLLAILFGAIYMVLPNRGLGWRDVILGAVATTVLFQVGEALIGAYLGLVALGHHYSTAGGVIVVLMWVYYSSQVFLFGAEITKVWLLREGPHASRFPRPLRRISARS